MLTLYHFWDSTCSMKVRFALAEKRLDYEGVFVDLLKFEQLQPDYLKINPNGVAPTLVHDGTSIVESTVINEYLEEVFPDVPLLPRDAARRAEVRALVRLEDGRAQGAFRDPTYHLMLKPMFADVPDAELDRVAARHPQPKLGAYWKQSMRSPVDTEAVEAAYEVLRSVMERLDRQLADGRPWLAGDEVTLAECSFVPFVDRTEHLGKGGLFEEFARLNAWRERLKSRASYAAAIPPDDHRLHAPVGVPARQREMAD